ncbi:MAG TPA: MmgE/PrpD family protein [Acidimicrobiales bacterium]|nr:MmgE/PrpD family protein [Acidimicrobiales bacterium]
MTPLEAFAARIVELSRETLPEEVAHETRRCFLNVLGTALGAGRSHEIDALFRTGAVLGGAEISVLGRTEVLDRYFCANALGFAAHFDDFDDTHLETVIHPGAATMGALYALGLCMEVPPDRALAGMALGVEAQLRIGLAMTPSHYDIGWHITGTCGVVGAAVGAGILLGLDAGELAHALQIALTMPLGQREAFGTPIKPYHAGKAAANGLLSATLAQQGVSDPRDLLTDMHGYFALLSDAWSIDWIDPVDMGRRWVILDNTYKPFPCGIVAHPAIEAATKLSLEFGVLDPASVEQVLVGCNPLVVELMGRRVAKTGLEARFCAIHGVAVGLLTGRAGLAEFSDVMAVDPIVVSLRDRTVLMPDDLHTRQAATVAVHLRDGTKRMFHVAEAEGSMERPLSDAQLREKFVALVSARFPERAEQLWQLAMQLGEGVSFADVDELVRVQ